MGGQAAHKTGKTPPDRVRYINKTLNHRPVQRFFIKLLRFLSRFAGEKHLSAKPYHAAHSRNHRSDDHNSAHLNHDHKGTHQWGFGITADIMIVKIGCCSTLPYDTKNIKEIQNKIFPEFVCPFEIAECQCQKTEPDPRMAAIQDIFNQFKEV